MTAYDATNTSVTLEWEDTIGSTQWMVSYAIDSVNTWTEVTANSNPFTLTGLNANTLYRYRVAPVCFDGQVADWSREVARFTTSQVPATVPYSYDFETPAEWANWQTSSNREINWYRGNVAQGNNTNAMYISVDNGATHSWNMSAITNAVAYRDIDFGPDAHSYQLEFDAYIGGTTDANYDGIAVVVADPAIPVASVSTAITSPWGHVNNVSYGTVRHDTLWGHHTVYLDGMSGVKRVAFYHFDQAQASSHPFENNPSAIDNVSITMQPCERPFGLAAENLTTQSATIAWTGDTSALYQVAYRVRGTAVSNTIYDTVRGSAYLINRLSPATDYSWWVRKICTLTETDTLISSWVSSVFTTACAPVSVGDTLREDFEGITPALYSATSNTHLPNCWESWTNNNATVSPHVTDSGSYSYCVSGRKAITLTAAGSSTSYGSNSYVRLIDIAEQTNTLTVAFWMCTEGGAPSGTTTYGELSVGYLVGDDYESDFVPIKTIVASAASQHTGNGIQPAGHGIFDTVSFDSVLAGNFPVAFRWHKESTYYSVCLDDIAVWTSNPACPSPDIDSVIAIDTAITFEWSGSAAQDYEVAIVAGEWSTPIIVTSVSGNAYTFTGLTAETEYSIGVRAACDENLYSGWATRSVVTTAHPCAVPTSLTSSNVTLTGATLGWTAEEVQNTWQIHINGDGYDQYHSAATNPYQVNGLDHGVTYTFTVRAICGEGDTSAWSSPATFTTLECVTPEQPSISGVTPYSATITWNAANVNSNNYQVEYGMSGFVQGGGTRVSAVGNTFTLSNLTPNFPYDVYVRSECATGVYSGWSPVASFTTSRVDTSVTYYTVTADVNNATMGYVTGAGTYAENTTATLTAVAYDGYHFVSWNTGATTATITVTVTGDVTYTATFEEDEVAQYTITVLANDPTMGTVTGGGTYDEGSTVTLGATANLGYHFVNWNTGATTPSLTITVTGDATYTANFAENDTSVTYYTVTAVANDTAMGTVTGGSQYAEGTTAILVATAKEHYRFVRWSNGATTPTISFVVTGDTSFTATFEAIPTHTLTVIVNNAAMGRVDGIPEGAVEEGTSVRLTAVANTGYRFDNWSTGETSASITVVVNSDMTVTANFSSVGIDDVANAAISLYPNPASSTVTLKGIEGKATVTVVDMNGRKAGEWTVSDGQLTIDVTEMAQGAYFVRIVGEQVNAIRKLIVR